MSSWMTKDIISNDYFVFSADEMIKYKNLISKMISDWMTLENSLKDKNLEVSKFLPYQIAVLELKLLPKNKKFPSILQDTESSSTFSRLLDLAIALEYSLSDKYIQYIKDKIFDTVISYNVSIKGCTTYEWSKFWNDYPFVWVLFLIQNGLRENGIFSDT